MFNNNNIDIKSIIALSGPHALQFGGALQLRIVMARRAPEGGSGHNRATPRGHASCPSLSSKPGRRPFVTVSADYNVSAQTATNGL